MAVGLTWLCALCNVLRQREIAKLVSKSKLRDFDGRICALDCLIVIAKVERIQLDQVVWFGWINVDSEV